MNGIDQIAVRGDFIDRSVILPLPPIPAERKTDERTFWARFHEGRPSILGALLDALAASLAGLDSVHLDRSPRMADFARRVVAAESALGWPPGAFMAAYESNRSEGINAGVDTDPLVAALRLLLDKHDEYHGTVGRLHTELETYVAESARRSHAWPKNAKNLSDRLRRLAPELRVSDAVTIEHLPRSNRGAMVRVAREAAEPPTGASTGEGAADATAADSHHAAHSDADRAAGAAGAAPQPVSEAALRNFVEMFGATVVTEEGSR